MPFKSGSISFQTFRVVGGKAPVMPSQDVLDTIKENALTPTELGLPEKVQWGWSGGRHIRDGAISFENNVFNDCIHIALQIEVNKVPGDVKQAFTQIEEEAVAANNPSGFISKAQKREVKDTVGKACDQELRSGKYRRTKNIPVLWDLANGVVYSPATGANAEKLCELFARTFADLELQPQTSGNVAMNQLDTLGKFREYEDLKPTRFAKSLEDPDMPAEYPWTAKGDGAKNFLGNEFLVWLWYTTSRSGTVETTSGPMTLMFDRTLQMDCVFGQSGKDTLTATGPTRMPEAVVALKTGKAPRKAGLILDCKAGQFNLTLTGESLFVGGAKLPEVEKADTARTLFEERITQLRDLNEALRNLYITFLAVRTDDTLWSGVTGEIRKWAQTGIEPTSLVSENADAA